MGIFEESYSSNKTWAKINRCRIYRIECVPIFGEALGILIFYKTEKLLKKYRENGVIKMTEDEIVNILSVLVT